jgi:hypothetical protein
MDANPIVATIARLSSSVSHHLTNWVGSNTRLQPSTCQLTLDLTSTVCLLMHRILTGGIDTLERM